MDACVICKEDIDNPAENVKLGEKGSIGINKASEERHDEIRTVAGQHVHQNCRRLYVNKYQIDKSVRQNVSFDGSTSKDIHAPALRSKQLYKFSEHCLFCGQL
ncbi:hypothetical protein KP79_PYT17548 [Mizuhopecten yessoensis]|uniref:Uncharacterized protein n=1 Tax=Mizuhopecten yessoensis TaxID=6573 RepID=A0A210QL46_MIZYE|nr:hypothetical protein KP79_PYT17548 [Mizuhopecten yessoensis]